MHFECANKVTDWAEFSYQGRADTNLHPQPGCLAEIMEEVSLGVLDAFTSDNTGCVRFHLMWSI